MSKFVLPGLIALPIAFLAVYGLALGETGYLQQSAGWVVGWTLLAWIAASVVFLAFIRYAGGCHLSGNQRCGITDRLHAFSGGLPAIVLTPKSVVAASAFLCCAWAAWFLANYPGGLSCWDTYYQISMCYPDSVVWEIPAWETGSVVDAAFSDHHPLFDTLVYGLFARVSDALFGSWNYGIFAFIALQGLATAISFALAVAYLERLGASRGLRLSLLAVFAFMPIYPGFADFMVKDTFFSWLFVLYFVAIIHVVRLKGSSLQDKRFVAAIVLLSLLLSLTKKPGLYIVLGTVLLLLIVYRSQWRSLLLSAIVPALVVWVAFPLAVFPALDVIPGGKQEALAMPFQMTARYVVECADEQQDWEIEAIDAVLGYEDLAARYTPTSADKVKFFWNTDCSTEDLIRYGSVWAYEGLRHPEVYFQAWFATVSGYFSPNSSSAISISTSINPSFSDKAWHPAILDGVREAMLSVYDFVSSIPVVGLLFSCVLYAFWIPALCFTAVWKWDKTWLPVFVPVLMTLVVLCITPVVAARYACPSIYIAPILFGVAWCVAKRAKTRGGAFATTSRPPSACR